MAPSDAVPSEASSEEIDEGECLALVGDAGVGRIGFTDHAEVFVYPVNFAREGRTIAFRTDEDSHLYKSLLSNVAFEVDGVDDGQRTGWSVLVRGVAREMSTGIDEMSARIHASGVQPWAPGAKPVWVRIVEPEISGIRLRRDA